jgi:microcystin-dependent protein
MDQPFIGQIILVPYNFAPLGWAFCDGHLLPIQGNDALFSLIGTTYGGDGVDTFALPDLRGRLPLHAGTGPGLSPHVLGETLGTEAVALSLAQLPSHTHVAACNASGGDSNSPVGRFWSRDAGSQSGTYHTSSGATMSANALGSAGGSQSHENMPPFLGLNFIIALEGLFPSQT